MKKKTTADLERELVLLRRAMEAYHRGAKLTAVNRQVINQYMENGLFLDMDPDDPHYRPGMRPWPKGVSGNPKGRPKGRMEVSTVLRRLMGVETEHLGKACTLAEKVAFVMLEEMLDKRDSRWADFVLKRVDPERQVVDADEAPRVVKTPLEAPV